MSEKENTQENLKDNSRELETEEVEIAEAEVEEGNELTQKNLELEETKERILRLHADFDNYRKRMQKEKEDWFLYASQGVLEKLLPVVDNLERALEVVENMTEETKNLFSGFALIKRQLTEVLEKEGVYPVAALGEKFDPNIHEAIMQVPPIDGQDDNQIVEELRKGYRYKERILRPSLVKVAKN